MPVATKNVIPGGSFGCVTTQWLSRNLSQMKSETNNRFPYLITTRMLCEDLPKNTVLGEFLCFNCHLGFRKMNRVF